MSWETGMLFDLGAPKDHRAITTDPMLFDIDIVWMDETKMVRRVDRGVKPHHQMACRARWVLELVAGAADVYGISVGAKLSWERPTK